jgi:hypothetical protein
LFLVGVPSASRASTAQREAAQRGIVGEVTATYRTISNHGIPLYARHRWPVDALHGDSLIDDHPVGQRAIHDTTASLINAVGYEDLVPGVGSVHSILNIGCSRVPICVRRRRSWAVQIHVEHRGRGVEDAKQEEAQSQLMKATLHNFPFPNVVGFISGTGFLCKLKISKLAVESGWD